MSGIGLCSFYTKRSTTSWHVRRVPTTNRLLYDDATEAGGACLRSRRRTEFILPVVDVAVCHGNLSSTDRCNSDAPSCHLKSVDDGRFCVKTSPHVRAGSICGTMVWSGEFVCVCLCGGGGFVVRAESHGNLYKFQTVYLLSVINRRHYLL